MVTCARNSTPFNREINNILTKYGSEIKMSPYNDEYGVITYQGETITIKYNGSSSLIDAMKQSVKRTRQMRR